MKSSTLREINVKSLTSAVAATFGLSRLIRHQRDNPSNKSDSNEFSVKTIESKLHLTDDLLKNKDNNPYITHESTDALTMPLYHLALQYIKQTHSTNIHIFF